MGRQTRQKRYPTPPSSPSQPRPTQRQARSDSVIDAAGASDATATATVGMFTPISHPFLRSVDPVQVSLFLKERERYELEISEKKKELPTLTVASYTSCIDRTLLKHMFQLSEFDDIAPEKTADLLSSPDIKKFIECLVKKPQSGYDPQCIEKALKDFRMPMHIADPAARVFHFASCFFERLEQIGYGDFQTDNPEKTTELMCAHLQPQKLRDFMTSRIEFDKSLKTDVKAFVKLVRKEAVSCQTYSTTKNNAPSGSKHDKSSRGAGSSYNDSSSQKEKPIYPVCLYPPHRKNKIRHLLKDCRACPEADKPALMEKYKAERAEGKKKQGAKGVSESAEASNPDNSVTFSATYGNKLYEKFIADTGADANLADTDLVQRIRREGGSVTTKNFVRPVVFSLAVGEGREGETIGIFCNQTAVMNVELHVRHGCSLMLRNLKWLVTEQTMSEPLLGRPTLEVLGLNTKEILAAAADRLHGDIDMSSALSESLEADGSGKIARVLGDGVYHSDGGVDTTLSEIDEDWLDFGEDDPAEKRAAIDAMLERTVNNGVTDDGLSALRNLTDEFHDVLRLRLGPGPPAKIEPMKIDLIDNARPIRAKQRRYPPEKRAFMSRVVSKLEQYGMIKITTDAEWVAAPPIVPKPPPANF